MTTKPENKEQWENMLETNIQVLQKVQSGFLESGSIDSAAIKAGSLATSAISSYVRNKASESAAEQTRVLIGRELGFTGDELREFTRLNLPRIALPLKSDQDGNLTV